MKKIRFAVSVACVSAAILVSACGGGGAGGGAAPTPTLTQTPTTNAVSVLVSGTAATGFAIAGGSVSMQCVSGASGVALTGDDGNYVLALTNPVFPCVARVEYQDAANTKKQLHSFVQAAGIVNITPLTELLLAGLTGNSPATAFDQFDAAKVTALTGAQLTAASGLVKNYLTSLGVETSSLPDDLIGIKFVAQSSKSSGDGFDKVLDDTGVKLNAAGLSLSGASGRIAAIGSQPGTLNALQSATNGSAVSSSAGNYAVGSNSSSLGLGAISTGCSSYAYSNATVVGYSSGSGSAVLPTASTSTQSLVPIIAPVPSVFLIGGAVQNGSLSLANVVSTLRDSHSVSLPGYGLIAPASITTDGNFLFVGDKYSIHKIEIDTGIDTVLAGQGAAYTVSGDCGTGDGIGAAALINSPNGITTDGTYIYFTETDGNRVRRLVIATGQVSTIATVPDIPVLSGGFANAGSSNQTRGIVNAGSSLYVTDPRSNSIRKIVIASGVVSTLAGHNLSGNSDGIGESARFNNPSALAYDGTHLYVTDTGNNSIRKIVIATGAVSTLAGAPGDFNRPIGITTDGASLYVTDTGMNRIQKIVIATGTVSPTVAGSGRSTLNSIAGTDDGVGVAASFASPQGITTDGISLYVADTGSAKVRKIR